MGISLGSLLGSEVTMLLKFLTWDNTPQGRLQEKSKKRLPDATQVSSSVQPFATLGGDNKRLKIIKVPARVHLDPPR